MTIKKLMMGAGAIDGPQVIAPSSNDWDYLGVMTASGNTLGDHTVGGSVGAVQNQEALSSLHTFDGDFVIAFDLTKRSHLAFGVHAIDEDDTRNNNDNCGMYSMTNSFWWGIDYSTGTQAKISSGDDGAITAPAEGSAIIIRRESGTITLEDDGSVIHTYSSTYSGIMRFAVANAASPYDADLDNIFFTDTDKVQRDGQFDEGGSNSAYGDSISNRKHSSTLFTATRTGTVTGLKVQVASVSTAFSTHAELWTHDGTNPAAQVGSDSDSITLDSTGVKNFTFTDPTVTKGRKYWMVMVDESTGGSVAMLDYTAHPQGMGAGRHDTITSISDDWSEGMKMEITIDTSDGEPTPDHETLLLVHSDTSDGSTTFVDSSQFGHTVTPTGSIDHATAQKKFGATSIDCQASDGHYLTIADNPIFEYANGQDFTIEAWVRRTATGSVHGVISKTGNISGWGDITWNLHIATSGKATYEHSNNGGAGVSLLSTTLLAADTWYHIAVVRIGNKWNLYINGTSEANTTSSITTLAASHTVRIGRRSDNTSDDFVGYIDEVRVSNVARWDANFTPPTSAYS